MRRTALLLLALPAALLANAGAGAASGAERGAVLAPPVFQRAEGTRAWRFPADHGQHPGYRLEWWYYTGILRTAQGRAFGYQVTFFRQGLTPEPPRRESAWRVHSLYLGHAALSDVQARAFHQAGRVGRDSLGLSGAAAHRLQVWLGPWRADPVPGDPHGAQLTADAGGFALRLLLRAEKAPVLHGEGGLDRKGAAPGQASWYYSLPRLRTEGTVVLDGRTQAVTGESWMDHEFGTRQLGPEEAGWDWISLRLGDGYDLMLYRLRQRDGGTGPASHGTLIDPQGRAQTVRLTAAALEPRRWWESPATWGRYPVAWRIDLPERALSLEIEPAFEAQEVRPGRGVPFGYWEGAVSARGTHGGHAVLGEGYLELTGYAGGLTRSFH
jgi:predicted secreted hydrolase